MAVNCCLIGLGQIGMGYDFDDEHTIYTHSKAIDEHNQFKMIAAVDINPIKRQLFEDKYCVPAFESINKVCIPDLVDLAVIATPTQYHLQTIAEACNKLTPRFMLCEKPVGYSYSSAKELIGKMSSTNMFVNYIRKCDPSFVEVKAILDANHSSFRIKLVLLYKSMYNNASHFLDLFNGWFGNVVSSLRLNLSQSPDISDDFSADFLVEYESADVVFQAGSEIAYSHYDLRIYFSNGLIEYSFGGRKISFYSSSDTRVNKDLGSMPPIEISSYFDKYQLHVYSSLYDAITGKSSSITTIDEALNTLQVLDHISKS